jgi:hypothetical protein
MLRKDKLWSPGFIILEQSQLVSPAGDTVYGIVLGFWVLSATGSTALMGILMACVSGGALIGYALLSAATIRAVDRMKVFSTTSFLFYALPVRTVIKSAFVLSLAVTLPADFSHAFRSYIKTDHTPPIGRSATEDAQ